MYEEALEVDQSMAMGIDSGIAFWRTVVLIVKRHLDREIEILRYAQDDKRRVWDDKRGWSLLLSPDGEMSYLAPVRW